MTLIAVSVGTDHHPFDRLVAWIDQWATANPEVDVFVQHGHAAAPSVARGAPLVTLQELHELFEQATAVVTHGGPATIMEVRRRGLVPIAVPRNPAHGEHVDDHQMRFVAHMAEEGLVVTARSRDELHQLLDGALAEPTSMANTNPDPPLGQAIRRFGQLVARLAPDGSGD